MFFHNVLATKRWPFVCSSTMWCLKGSFMLRVAKMYHLFMWLPALTRWRSNSHLRVSYRPWSQLLKLWIKTSTWGFYLIYLFIFLTYDWFSSLLSTFSAQRPVAGDWGSGACFAAAPTPGSRRWWCPTACADSTTNPKPTRPASCGAAPRTTGCSGFPLRGER